jgi:formyl-CoA transferase/CoA:oxalate CoA-transferase
MTASSASADPSTSPRPLEGLRVVDFSRMMSGPLSTMVMGDLGAHVIRVEDLEGTDTTRHNHPFINGESHYFLSLNRNKESIALDLKTEEGRKIAIDLVRQADIVVENFRHGVAARLGLDYESLIKVNPRLVYCSVTGFGQTGPWNKNPAYDLVIQAVTGALSVTGEAGRPPAKMGLPLADEMSSLFAGIAMLAGIERRERTGLGCYLDISMYDAGISMLSYMANIYFATGESPTAQGSSHPTIYPYNAFETADGYIVVAPFTNAFWRKFSAVIERPDLPDNPRYRVFADRLANRSELAAILEPIMKTRSSAHWLAALDKGDVPNGQVAKIDEVLEGEHTKARGMVVEIDHPVCGRIRSLGTPFHFEYADGSAFKPVYAPQPVVGQHSAAILEDLLGYSAEQIAALKEQKVVRVSDVPGKTSVQRRADADATPPVVDDATRMEPPLHGLKVLDLTRMLAGPYGTLVLADLGADVIKIEEPRVGDPTRRNIPMVGDESTYFMAVNRGKRSVTLDLKTAEGKAQFLELVETADIVVENYRPGVMARLGLAYADLCKVKPDIILCSISGYGQTGPLKDKISFDLVNQAMAGTMSVTGEEGRPPVRVGLPAGDLSGGIFGALAVMAALFARRRTGKGAHIDLGLHDLLVSLLGYVAQLYFTTGEVPGPVGSGHHHIAPYRAFQAKDGYFVIAAFTQVFWLKFVKVIGKPELADDPRFADITARKHNKDALYEIIDPLFLHHTVDEWVDMLRAGDVPVARVYSVGEALESEHAAARNIVFDYDHPTVGKMRTAGTPFIADGRLWRSTLPPPLLGQHNDEVLGPLRTTQASATEAAHAAE